MMKRVAAGVLAALCLSDPLAAQPAAPYAGLWVGTVSVDKVSQSQFITGTTPNPCPTPPTPCAPTQGTSTTPVPVGREFTFRLILHIDASGTVRLLKDVIQMYKPAVGATPGRYVLVTDASLIPAFSGTTERDGDLVAKRVSSAAIDFPATAPDYALTMSGGVTTPGTGSASVTFTVDRDFVTNPFKHKYHPDHDNAGATGPVAEAFDVTRTLSLTFSSVDPSGQNPPGYGSTVLGGSYSELFPAGSLHKNPIAVSGTFRLDRVSLVARLNQ